VGPSRHDDAANLPVRGDLAHIRLAGEVFVPHYAVPMPHEVCQTTPLLSAARDDATILCELPAATQFDVLDVAGKWAWGCVTDDGPVGYVALTGLKAL